MKAVGVIKLRHLRDGGGGIQEAKFNLWGQEGALEGSVNVKSVCTKFQFDPARGITIDGVTVDVHPEPYSTQTYVAGTTADVVGTPLQDRSSAGTPAISQAGSLAEGELLVDVVMEFNGRVLHGSLLVDTGCDLDINISEYKADQLGLPYDGASAKLEMGQGTEGAVRRRGPVLTKLKLVGESDEVLDDPMRSKYLEVWTDVGTAGSARSTTPAVVNNTSPGTPLTVTVSQMPSPIKRGKDSKGYDAILGGPGMLALKLGIDRETGRLYIKKRTSHRRM